jgi:hypothetical protein
VRPLRSRLQRPPAVAMSTAPPPFRLRRPIGSTLVMLCTAAAVIGWILPGAAAAQAQESTWTAPRWVGDVAFLGSSALLGGLTAGTLQRLEGGDFRDGFTRGALGGAAAYMGRRIGAERFPGAGLVGRQVSGVGASIVRNASDGRPTLEELVLPIGPVRFHVDRSGGLEVTPRIVLRDLGWTVAFALRSETEFDWASSLSAGAPVFRSPRRSFLGPGGEGADGVQTAGVIGLSDIPDDLLRSAFAHERVHLLQHDFSYLVWSEPIERRLMERSGITRHLARYAVPGVVFPLVRGAFFDLLDMERSREPAEVEAMFLDRRRR